MCRGHCTIVRISIVEQARKSKIPTEETPLRESLDNTIERILHATQKSHFKWEMEREGFIVDHSSSPRAPAKHLKKNSSTEDVLKLNIPTD